MRRLAGEHLIKHRAQRVDVGTAIDGAVAGRLLRAHVRGRAETQARLGDAMSAGLRDRERNPEVGDDRLLLLKQHVLRLEVAVDDVVAVRVVEGARDRRRYADGFVDRKLLLAIEPLSKRLAFDEGHDVEERSARRLSGVEEREDILVLEVRGDADLGEEALDAHHRGEVGVQDLERDVSVVFEVAREIDGRHAPGADLALDDVAIGERTNELVTQLRHGANVTGWRREG